MGYSGRDGGSEWMGVPPSRKPRRAKASESFKETRKAKLKSAAARKRNNAFDAQGRGGFGSYSFPKSSGANSSASRFGMDEPAPKRKFKAVVPKPARRPFIGLRDMSPKRGGR